MLQIIIDSQQRIVDQIEQKVNEALAELAEAKRALDNLKKQQKIMEEGI